jgi:hypothetical protein
LKFFMTCLISQFCRARPKNQQKMQFINRERCGAPQKILRFRVFACILLRGIAGHRAQFAI